MKNTIKLLCLAAFLAAIGLTFSGCDSDPPTVTVSGTARVGQTINATSTGGVFTGNFRWEFSAIGEQRDWGDWIFVPGMNTGTDLQVLEIGSGAQGRFVRASRMTEGGNRIFSNVLGPIAAY